MFVVYREDREREREREKNRLNARIILSESFKIVRVSI